MTNRKKLKTWMFRAAPLLAGLAAGLALAEAGLAALGLPRAFAAYARGGGPEGQFHFLKDPAALGGAGYVNAPGATLILTYIGGEGRPYFLPGGRVEHHVNSIGFRGPEFTLEPAPGVRRIVFLGDSFTFGEGVIHEETYAERTRSLLEEAEPGRRTESINLGVGGYNTFQEAAVLRTLGLALKPSAVAVGFTLNDAEPELFRRNPATGEMERRPVEEIAGEGAGAVDPPVTGLYRSRVARLIWGFFTGRRQTARTLRRYRELYAEGSADWERCRGAIAEMGAALREAGIPGYAVLFPLLHRIGDDPFRAEREKAAKEFEKAGFRVIDVAPALAGKRDVELWVHPADHHPNEIVHRAAAELLAARILKDGGK